MIEQTARTLREAVGTAAILGPASRYAHLGLPVFEDLVPDCGPLGGLYTALHHCDRALLAPVDLPYLDVAFLQRLTGDSGGQCVIAKGQPLCGVYDCSALPVIADAIRAGRLRMTELAAALGAVEIAPDDPLVLQNRNAPGDWTGVD